MKTVTVTTAEKGPLRLFARIERLAKGKLTRFVEERDFSALSPEEAAKEFGCTDYAPLCRLLRRMERCARRLHRQGKLDHTRLRGVEAWIATIHPEETAEILSPYHTLLAEKEFYALSDLATRRRLRDGIARFAKYHRLDPSSAALLWKGEAAPPARGFAWLLLLPLPLTALAGGILLPRLPREAILPALLALPAVFGGGYLLVMALLQKMLPPAPLPLLKTGEGHPILTVCVGSLSRAREALEGVARLAASGQSDCRYLLLLFRPDSLLREEAGEARQEAALQREAEALEERLEANIRLLLPRRQYDPKRKRWLGTPTLSGLAALLEKEAATCTASAEGGEEHMPAPEAVCILPADSFLLPGTPERMAAALFHPLAGADCLTFLALTGASSTKAAPIGVSPGERVFSLRQCLLQKLNAPADLCGWGIYRPEALHSLAKGVPPSPRLAPFPLYGAKQGMPAPYSSPLRQTPSLYNRLEPALALLRPLLLLALIIARVPPLPALAIWSAASADLGAAALLSLRLTPKKLYLSHLPALKKLGKTFLHRTLLPLEECVEHFSGGRIALALASLLWGAAIIAFGAPLSFLGVIWIAAPLLFTEQNTRPALSPKEKGACCAIAEEVYPLLTEGGDLPPAYRRQTGEMAPYTTPSTLGSSLVATLAAYELGICDLRTLSKRIDSALTKLEALPTRCGLPYARYAVETGDAYKDSSVDSGECGLLALCLSALEAGLWEYVHREPALGELAKRTARLSARMDFTLLLGEGTVLCRRLTPEGEREGVLSHLLGTGGYTLFAALSSDSTLAMGSREKVAAWNALAAPVTIRRGRCRIASPEDSLWEALLPLLLLPVPRGSLLDFAADAAIREALRQGRYACRKAAKQLPALADASSDTLFAPHSFLRKLREWPPFARRPRPLAADLSSAKPQPLPLPLLCLLLKKSPKDALAHLQQSPDLSELHTAPLALSLIALSGAVTGRTFGDRILALPRTGALAPLLRNAPDSILRYPPRLAPATEALPQKAMATAPVWSVYLLGDAQHGLLLAGGQGLSLWEGGRPLTAPAEADQLFASGRMTGLLLAKEGKLLPLPEKVARREPHLLHLGDASLSLLIRRIGGGWSLLLCRQTAEPTDLRFLFSPACKEGQRMRLSTLTDENGEITLLLETSTMAIAIHAKGLTAPFTHADPSPLPRGKRQAAAIFALPPVPAEGLCETPTAIIGGRFEERELHLRLVIASHRTAALELLTQPLNATSVGMTAESPVSPPLSITGKGSPFPLPAPDESPGALTLSWQLRALFAGQPLPAVTVIGHTLLARCMKSGHRLLSEKGFPASPSLPIPLTVKSREGAEALLRRLSPSPPDAETPLLPSRGTLLYCQGFPEIHRGRDLPHLCRLYQNGIASLQADPECLTFRPSPGEDAFPLSLTLRKGERTLLLPAAAEEVCYRPAWASFIGEGFRLTVALLPKLPLLSVELEGAGEADLSLPTLPSPHKVQEGDALRYLTGGRVLFCRRLPREGGTIWLLGSFPRAQDHLYYWMREAITLRSLPDILREYDKELSLNCNSFAGISPDAPPLSSVAAAVLGSGSTAGALIAPICAPKEAKALLLRLATESASLLLPCALLIYCALTGDRGICDCRVPVEGGKESLYLHAARSLEAAMESAPDNPLLPLLTAAFARLAADRGDPAAPLYEGFTASSQERAPAGGRDPLWRCSRKVVRLLADLAEGTPDAVNALWDALCRLPTDPSPEGAALLWSGMLWGVLGIRPAESGFSLAPMAVERECAFRLSYRGEWLIRLSPAAPPHCSPAGEENAQGKKEQNISLPMIFSRQNSCIVHKNGVK